MKKSTQKSKLMYTGSKKGKTKKGVGLNLNIKDRIKKRKKKNINHENKRKKKFIDEEKLNRTNLLNIIEKDGEKFSKNQKKKEIKDEKKEKRSEEIMNKGEIKYLTKKGGENKIQTTDKPNKQIKTEHVMSSETPIRKKSIKNDESSKFIKEKTDDIHLKKLEDELDFSCLAVLCKYKMKIKRKEHENEETFKKSQKKEIKQKEKQRENEKLRELPENIVNSSLFRYINEYMYKNKSEIVQKKLNESKSMFHIYHTGYKNQVNKWPNNPAEIIIKFLKNNFTKNDKIADFGCGEAQIAHSLHNWNIVSFDLIKYNKYVTVANITKLDIPDDSYDCIIISLSLMNTDWPKIIYEASRCLKKNGILVVAEVASRFVRYKSFFKFMKKMKFKALKKANLDDFFFLLFFGNVKKNGDLPQPMSEKKVQITSEILAPCLYRRR